MVDVQREAHLVDVEVLGTVHVRDRNHHELELVLHDSALPGASLVTMMLVIIMMDWQGRRN